MKVAVFSTKPYDRSFLTAAADRHEFVFFEPRLAPDATKLAAGFPAVCAFVNDQLDTSVLTQLADQRTNLIALRCAGFNNVDLAAARDLGLTVVRVPGYSPYAVAEHIDLVQFQFLVWCGDWINRGSSALRPTAGGE